MDCLWMEMGDRRKNKVPTELLEFWIDRTLMIVGDWECGEKCLQSISICFLQCEAGL